MEVRCAARSAELPVVVEEASSVVIKLVWPMR